MCTYDREVRSWQNQTCNPSTYTFLLFDVRIKPACIRFALPNPSMPLNASAATGHGSQESSLLARHVRGSFREPESHGLKLWQPDTACIELSTWLDACHAQQRVYLQNDNRYPSAWGLLLPPSGMDGMTAHHLQQTIIVTSLVLGAPRCSGHSVAHNTSETSSEDFTPGIGPATKCMCPCVIDINTSAASKRGISSSTQHFPAQAQRQAMPH